MKPIAIFYHCRFFKADGGAYQRGGPIIAEQMEALIKSGLVDAASHFTVGLNGGKETEIYAKIYLPTKAVPVFHGLQSGSEVATVILMEKFAADHPGWNILYFHNKGCTHTDLNYIEFLKRWVRCMMNACVVNWRTCIKDLETADSVGCHWMRNVGVPPKDNIWGGNFFWMTSDFMATLPLIEDRELCKKYGVFSKEARYESERWVGAGPKLPRIVDYHIDGIGICP
jgi:hypothetical protein